KVIFPPQFRRRWSGVLRRGQECPRSFGVHCPIYLPGRARLAGGLVDFPARVRDGFPERSVRLDLPPRGEGLRPSLVSETRERTRKTKGSPSMGNSRRI